MRNALVVGLVVALVAVSGVAAWLYQYPRSDEPSVDEQRDRNMLNFCVFQLDDIEDCSDWRDSFIEWYGEAAVDECLVFEPNSPLLLLCMGSIVKAGQ